jgi:hypothetical protein
MTATLTIYSVPIQYEGNNVTFAYITGQPVFQGEQGWAQNNKIVFVKWNAYFTPHLETLLLAAVPYQPLAAVVYGSTFSPAFAFFFGASHLSRLFPFSVLPPTQRLRLTSLQPLANARRVIGYPQYVRFGIDTAAVTFPVVQMDEDSYASFRALFNATKGNITLVIDDSGENEWVKIRKSGWFIFFGVSLGVFEAINLACAIWVLSGHWPFQRSLVTVCLLLEILANSLRLIFLFEPFSGFVWISPSLPRCMKIDFVACRWSYGKYLFPNSVSTVFYTISFPITTSVTILLTFYWSELVSRNPTLQISALLTKTRIPAAIFIVLICIFEIISSSARAAVGGVTFLTIINGCVICQTKLVLPASVYRLIIMVTGWDILEWYI